MIAATATRVATIIPDPAQALLTAQATVGRMVGRQALTTAFDEVFRTMAWMFLAALVIVPFCRVPKGAPAAPAEAH